MIMKESCARWLHDADGLTQALGQRASRIKLMQFAQLQQKLAIVQFREFSFLIPAPMISSRPQGNQHTSSLKPIRKCIATALDHHTSMYVSSRRLRSLSRPVPYELCDHWIYVKRIQIYCKTAHHYLSRGRQSSQHASRSMWLWAIDAVPITWLASVPLARLRNGHKLAICCSMIVDCQGQKHVALTFSINNNRYSGLMGSSVSSIIAHGWSSSES